MNTSELLSVIQGKYPTIPDTMSTRVRLGQAMKLLEYDSTSRGHTSYYKAVPLKAAWKSKTYYYEFRNGTRLIHPAIQEEIRSLFRQADWKEDVHFDSYVEDYDW